MPSRKNGIAPTIRASIANWFYQLCQPGGASSRAAASAAAAGSHASIAAPSAARSPPSRGSSAHGVASDAELLGEQTLGGDRVARLQPAGEDVVMQPLVDGLGRLHAPEPYYFWFSAAASRTRLASAASSICSPSLMSMARL